VARGVDVDPATGAIVVAGAVGSGTDDHWGILMYNAYGTLDTSYSGGWEVLWWSGATYNRCNAVAFQTSPIDGLGRVLCAGWIGFSCSVSPRQDECPLADAYIFRTWR
jgi:hypothetical protein